MAINYTHVLINSTYMSEPFGMFKYANLVSNNAYGVILFFSLAVIYMMAGIRTIGFKQGVTNGGFATWLTSVFMSVGGIIQPTIVVATSLLYFMWLIYLYYEGE